MFRILSTLIVSRFYKLNAGFFLFSFLILFAILPGPDTIRLHHGLMLAAVSSPVNILVAIFISSLYNLKCISYTQREISLAENEFLYNLQGSSNLRQYRLLGITHISIYAPILLYSIVAVFVGFQSQHITGSILLLLVQLIMIIAGTYTSFHNINSTWKKPVFVLPSISLFRNRGFFTHLLQYSINEKKGPFISIKVFSMLALQLLVALNADNVSRENICFLILLSISAHALLPTYYVRFLETEMSFLRNLPIPLPKRLLQFTVTYAAILLPELIFLLYNEINVISLPVIISLYLLAIVRLSLFTAIQYFPKLDLNKYTGVIFAMFFITIILLASFSLWLFISIEFIITILLFAVYYYRYEPLLLKEE